MLQDRHLPWYLPIIHTNSFTGYEAGGFAEEIFSFTLDDVSFSEGYFIIKDVDQNIITKIIEQEHILAF